MSNGTEKIVSSILSDAKFKADSISEEAENESKSILEESEKKRSTTTNGGLLSLSCFKNLCARVFVPQQDAFSALPIYLLAQKYVGKR